MHILLFLILFPLLPGVLLALVKNDGLRALIIRASAVVIGGAKLSGGAGSVSGVLLGMTLVTLLNNTLVTIGLSASWNRFFIGCALVLIASISHYRAKMRNLRQLNFENI